MAFGKHSHVHPVSDMVKFHSVKANQLPGVFHIHFLIIKHSWAHYNFQTYETSNF